eukprot:CAMPEP_0206425316 /NCGR_PEP_ID=MMETSP0324_2-20121206/3722_1 /ASSEMBLY_ACC=CAM_ASM_000836 /TAXON_ID=2866 /ORGANISM="Crypthecodinium cohnii, Strain Seligo" /LENGTH=176 /DNA_ID=CAMNT_0053890081 /DNA_START=250 /DNA_END=776 /DNA_ORIENTATION=+
MFQCRVCTENPFSGIFGGGQDNRKTDQKTKKKGNKKNRRNHHLHFTPRNPQEVDKLVEHWMVYVHDRAREFFATAPDKLEETLALVVAGVDRNDDPILGPEDRCVLWCGEVTEEDEQPAIRMPKPNETAESVTYVNRVLPFIFATDESFEQLMRLPKEPFKMSCGDQYCVHLGHIL